MNDLLDTEGPGASPPGPRPDHPGTGQPSPNRDGRDDAPMPPAGPHADPELTDETRTPGAGALPDPEGETSVEPGSG